MIHTDTLSGEEEGLFAHLTEHIIQSIGAHFYNRQLTFLFDDMSLCRPPGVLGFLLEDLMKRFVLLSIILPVADVT